jgi:N-methylhydantoinase B
MTDPIELAIFKSTFHSIAEEMGAALRRTAFSPNIKERRDYSSALFDHDGNIIAMGDDMPVHLGSMPMSVRAVLNKLTLESGDIAILNDPYDGGTHLPDITLVIPAGEFFAANRAHHADVGGMYPGSMGLCREIWQEGIRIPPVKLVSNGVLNQPLLALLLNNVRTPQEREGDLTAQIGACRIGVQRLAEMTEKYGLPRLRRNVSALLNHSEELMRAELAQWPEGEFSAEDFLDNDGLNDTPVKICVTLRTNPAARELEVDFTGSAPQIATSLNAVAAITYSATFYVLRCLLPEEAAPTAGLMRPVKLILPEGSVVNARLPAAVAGGNVETSQRLTDVLLKALAQMLPEKIPAASSGTMNNLTIGGIDPRTGQTFAYYETIAGGSGARPNGPGVSGVHTHMTNSLNTPVEALEYAYPFRVRQYSYRPNSGGTGQYKGGDGIIREIELLGDAQVTLLADRRSFAPYGLQGGSEAQRGRAFLNEKELPGKCNVDAKSGSTLRIETPGGGGWGSLFEAAVEAVVAGDISTLQVLLQQNPELIKARSTRSHQATLLHYIGANGVEDYRQKTPTNALQIAAALLKAGAEVDAVAFLYGTSTTLNLVASSIHPQKAGVQTDLIHILIDAGASIEGSLLAAITNCRLAAAEALIQRGVPVDNIIAAAALGNLPLTESLFPQSSRTQRGEAFIYACLYGQTAIAAFLLDHGVDPTASNSMGQTGMHFAADAGHLETIQMLIERKVPLNVKNRYGGTVLGQAIWSSIHEPKPTHPAIIKALEAANAS